MTSNDALIGHTGFVGGHLDRQHGFAARFNSRTIGDAADREFGTVVCAAAPGSMFEANRMPDQDRAKIDALIGQLDRLRCARFVLISSIAVLADFAGGDDESTGAFQETLAYGRHRRALEAFCESRFADCLIVRLPALFGTGLRKNFVFDLMNPVPSMLTDAAREGMLDALPGPLADRVRALYAPDPATGMHSLDRPRLDADPARAGLEEAVTGLGLSATRFHNPRTTYQYYDMTRLWADTATARGAGLPVLHCATEPLVAARIHERLLGRAMPDTGARLHSEDMRTAHAGLWGRSGPYLDHADAVLERIAALYDASRAARP